MICSLHRIELVTGSGTFTLLDFDEMTQSEPDFSAEQNTVITWPLLKKYAGSFPLGGVSQSLTWTRIRSVAKPRTQAMRDTISLPWGISGYLRFSVKDGDAFVFLQSSLKGVSPSFEAVPNWLIQAYTAELGEPSMISVGGGLNYTSQPVGAAATIFSPGVSGGLAPYSAAIVSGALPPGYSLTTSGGSVGQISGTPTTAGFYKWQLAIADSRGSRVALDQEITITP